MIDKDFLISKRESVADFLKEEFYIYFLFDKEEIVYVGKTVNFTQRVKHHKQSKEFDSYYLLKCKDQEEIDKLEFDYIVKFEPKYNKILPKSDKYLTVNKIKERYSLGAWDFKRFIKRKGIKHKVCLSGILHYDVKDFEELEV